MGGESVGGRGRGGAVRAPAPAVPASKLGAAIPAAGPRLEERGGAAIGGVPLFVEAGMHVDRDLWGGRWRAGMGGARPAVAAARRRGSGGGHGGGQGRAGPDWSDRKAHLSP